MPAETQSRTRMSNLRFLVQTSHKTHAHGISSLMSCDSGPGQPMPVCCIPKVSLSFRRLSFRLSRLHVHAPPQFVGCSDGFARIGAQTGPSCAHCEARLDEARRRQCFVVTGTRHQTNVPTDHLKDCLQERTDYPSAPVYCLQSIKRETRLVVGHHQAEKLG